MQGWPAIALQGWPAIASDCASLSKLRPAWVGGRREREGGREGGRKRERERAREREREREREERERDYSLSLSISERVGKCAGKLGRGGPGGR